MVEKGYTAAKVRLLRMVSARQKIVPDRGPAHPPAPSAPELAARAPVYRVARRALQPRGPTQ